MSLEDGGIVVFDGVSGVLVVAVYTNIPSIHVKV